MIMRSMRVQGPDVVDGNLVHLLWHPHTANVVQLADRIEQRAQLAASYTRSEIGIVK